MAGTALAVLYCMQHGNAICDNDWFQAAPTLPQGGACLMGALRQSVALDREDGASAP